MKKKTKYKIVIGIILALTVLVYGLIWFAKNSPQTGFQRASSFLGYGKPDADARSRVVFLGDSITARENWNLLFGVSYIFNAGISGNTSDDIIARLKPIISSKPQKIFLMVGINDFFLGKDAYYVTDNYSRILDQIKSGSPDTKIFIQSVLPVNQKIAKVSMESQRITTLNDNLRMLAKDKGAVFIDLYSHFCGPDNEMYAEYAGDGVHLNYRGYAVWKSLLIPYVK